MIDPTTGLAIMGAVAAALGLGIALAAHREIDGLRDHVAWLQRELFRTSPDDPNDGERALLPIAENDDEAAHLAPGMLYRTALGVIHVRRL